MGLWKFECIFTFLFQFLNDAHVAFSIKKLTFGVLWEVFLCWNNSLSFVGILYFFYDWVYVKLLLLVFKDKGYIKVILSFLILLPLLLLFPFAVFVFLLKGLRIFSKILLELFVAGITEIFVLFLILNLLFFIFSFSFPVTTR